MKKAYRYKIKPTMKQQKMLSQFFGCARFIYNWGLNRKIEAYKTDKKSIGYVQLAKELTDLKKQDDTKWLNDCANECLQQSLRNLDNAYTRFFKEKKGFPKFKSKKNSKDVCKFINSVKFDFDKRKVWIPKIGWTKLCHNKEFDLSQVKLGTLTVSKDKCGEYWCVILVDDMQPNAPKTKVQKETSVGIDLGIKDFATLSDGTKVENPKYLERSQKKLAHLQKVYSRRQKDSKRRERVRLAVAKCHRRIANQRTDFLHKLTTELVRCFDTICLEDLNVEGMMKNHYLAKSIVSASWYQFKTILGYKSEWYGKNVLFIGRFDPSSKTCNHCGYVNKDLKLSDRKWKCPKCGEVIDRDINAAINIRDWGIHPQSLVANSAKDKDIRHPQVSGGEDVEGRGYEPCEASI